MTSLAEKWIRESAHKPYCNLAPRNIYADGDFCDCGLEAALKSLEETSAVTKQETVNHRIYCESVLGKPCTCGLDTTPPAVTKEITLQKRPLEDLINQAAKELPEDWQIIIETEQGYAEVIVYDPNGVPTLFQDDTPILEQFANALAYVRINSQST